MRVHFPDSEVFDDPTVFDSLNRLFARADQGVHELSFGDVEHLQRSAMWKVGIAPYKRVAWEERLRRLGTGSDNQRRDRTPGDPPEKLHVLVGARPGRPADPVLRHVPADEIGVWSETPLRLLLENKRDFTLLVGAARVYAPPPSGGRTWLELAEAKRALHVDGRGGCGEVLTELKDLADPDGADVRIFIAIDSDRTEPSGNVGSAQRRIEDRLAELGKSASNKEICSWILKKREVENYIPRAQLFAHTHTPDHKRKLRSWEKLSELERDFDDIKARFSPQWTAACLSAMGEEPLCFTASDLDARAGQELRELLIALEERL